MDEFRDKVFIVKVPELVYNSIMKSREKDFGQIEITQSHPCATKELNVNLYNTEAKKFTLPYSSTDSYFLFSDKNTRPANYLGRFVSADEDISDKVTMSVQKEQEKHKQQIAIDYAKGRQISESIIKLSDYQYITSNDSYQKAINQKNRKDKNLKKTRRDKEVLKNEIFDLFSDKKYWTNRELVAKLDQPENYLKEVLGEICNYIKSGPKKGCYELKQQYVFVHDDKMDN
jgi:hypothetical protein